MGVVYCYNDGEKAGSEIAACIEARQGSSQIFTHAEHIDDEQGVVAFHYPPQGPEADHVQTLAETLSSKKKIVQIPSAREMRLHNRIVDQYVSFGQWMPSGWLFRNMDDFKAQVNKIPFPVVSMSNSGDVRPIKDSAAGLIECAEAFKGQGHLLSSGKRQTGYIFWMTELVQQSSSWRVFMFVNRYAVVVRHGDGRAYPMDVLSEQLVELLKYAYAFMLDNCFTWGSVEILAGADRMRQVRSPFVGFFSMNWPKRWFLDGGMIFETTTGEHWESTGIPAVRWYDLCAEQILSGGFDGR